MESTRFSAKQLELFQRWISKFQLSAIRNDNDEKESLHLRVSQTVVNEYCTSISFVKFVLCLSIANRNMLVTVYSFIFQSCRMKWIGILMASSFITHSHLFGWIKRISCALVVHKFGAALMLMVFARFFCWLLVHYSLSEIDANAAGCSSTPELDNKKNMILIATCATNWHRTDERLLILQQLQCVCKAQ